MDRLQRCTDQCYANFGRVPGCPCTVLYYASVFAAVTTLTLIGVASYAIYVRVRQAAHSRRLDAARALLLQTWTQSDGCTCAVAAAAAVATRAARTRRAEAAEIEGLLDALYARISGDGRQLTVLGALTALCRGAVSAQCRRDPRTGGAGYSCDQGLVSVVLSVPHTGPRLLSVLGFTQAHLRGWGLPHGQKLNPMALAAVGKRERLLRECIEWRKEQRKRMREVNRWMDGLTPEQRADKAEAMIAENRAAWLELHSSAPEPVTASSVPWPRDVTQALRYVREPKQALRELQLLYHPDKFVQKVGTRITPQGDLPGLMDRITAVSQELNAMRDMFTATEEAKAGE
eukprot:TRINITY_DN14678_c0_g1_i1.p1 TRINITY_DN14678_c0_g1~~TRINITY_DN14678_c0_g1_i1.p1  ORF type:complete len:345 (+),score=35.85 TRINITY_DN14678_c0_g1_i1:68-1102(+)